MRAKSVNEDIKHLSPRSKEEIDLAILDSIKYKEIKRLIDLEDPKSFCCLYLWDADSSYSKYYTNIKSAFSDYIQQAKATFKDASEDRYKVHKIYSLYTINPSKPGVFIDSDGAEGSGGVNVLFDIEFQNGKVYYHSK